MPQPIHDPRHSLKMALLELVDPSALVALIPQVEWEKASEADTLTILRRIHKLVRTTPSAHTDTQSTLRRAGEYLQGVLRTRHERDFAIEWDTESGADAESDPDESPKTPRRNKRS